MKISALLIIVGLTAATITITVANTPTPTPQQPDLAAIELQKMQDEMKRQEQSAEEKLDWFYGRRRTGEGSKQ